MSIAELIATLEQGVREGRVAPYLADFILAQTLDRPVDDIGYSEWGSLPADLAALHAEQPPLHAIATD